MIWFTSDHHFGHANIIEYCNRLFDSVEEMDEELVRAWNEVVEEDDVVYHLGDFTLGNKKMAKRCAMRLKGTIAILSLPWHHDCRWVDRNVCLGDPYCPIVETGSTDVIKLDGYVYPDTERILTAHLSHYPIREWDRKHYGALHFHGHEHTSSIYRCQLETNMLNVGVDSARILLGEYRPFSLNEAVAFARTGVHWARQP